MQTSSQLWKHCLISANSSTGGDALPPAPCMGSTVGWGGGSGEVALRMSVGNLVQPRPLPHGGSVCLGEIPCYPLVTCGRWKGWTSSHKGRAGELSLPLASCSIPRVDLHRTWATQ